MPSRAQVVTEDDPLTRALAPPSNETPTERQARLLEEQEAKKISDLIDEEINRQKLADKRAPKPVKILLLGQSESGKSTTLKNFQLMNSPKAFRAERASWRAVVQLNVVRSVRTILDAMTEAQAATFPPSPPEKSTPVPQTEYPALTAEHLKLKMRLAPLVQVEETLLRKLSPSNAPDIQHRRLASLTNIPYSERATMSTKEPSVNSTAAWKVAFSRLLANRDSLDSDNVIDWDDPEDPGVILNIMAEDINKLWSDPTIKELLRVQKLRLEEMAGFFLDELDRVTQLKYVPTDDDILRARIKTLGVTEYRFTMKAGNSLSHDWRVFDVGGQRSLRAAWVPFFDDMNAIIFLAPISCFDQVLAEDASVNRLEDSVLLWKSIVSNPVLLKTDIVLFLNKCDILQAKLETGILLSDYIVSYGQRPNDFESASQYLKKKFAVIFNEKRRGSPFYCHFTTVTDTKSTSTVLEDVQDIAVRQNLKNISLIV